MQLSALQIVLLVLVAAEINVDRRGLSLTHARPVIVGFLCGLILGDMNSGLYIGGTFTLMSLGVAALGGSSVPDYGVATIIACAFAKTTGQGPEVGMTIGLPVGMLGVQMDVLYKICNSFIAQKSQKYANEKQFGKMYAILYLCPVMVAVFMAFPTAVALTAGAPLVQAILDVLPSWVTGGLSVAGKLLPGLGIAMLLHYMPAKKYFNYILIGFVLSAYMGVPILGIAFLGVALAYKFYMDEEAKENVGFAGGLEGAIRWSLMAVTTFNYDTQLAPAVVFGIGPLLRKIYKDDDEYVEALNNHYKYFNTMPWLANIVLGATLALEDKEGISSMDAVQNIKVSLMGPLAGIGDTLFWTLLPTIMGSIAGYMALEGNPIGVILWLIVNLIFICIRTQLMWIGYREGTKLITKVGSKLARITDAASVLGLTVVGALSATVVTAKTPLAFQMGEVNLAVADLLDKIMPSMISVATVLVLYKLLGKKGMKITTLILIVIIFSMICSALGILA